MTQRATGSFQIAMKPLPTSIESPEGWLGRMSIDKTYNGDIEATARGEMLAASTGADGSAGYVAMERVTGTLHGMEGSFMLQHSGLMDRGARQLTIHIIPDSGTDQLEGLSGTLLIEIENGKHTFVLDYSLPR